MGTCWSDEVRTGDMFEVTKKFKEDGDKIFYQRKQDDPDVREEIER